MIIADKAVVSDNQKVKQYCTADSFPISSRNKVSYIGMLSDHWHGSNIFFRDLKTTYNVMVQFK